MTRPFIAPTFCTELEPFVPAVPVRIKLLNFSEERGNQRFERYGKGFSFYSQCRDYDKYLKDMYQICTLTLRLLMSYIYGAPILDVSRSHTTTHHSR